jgi:hypothetical protein
MKPRHAAALTLVGWYLMIPPTRDNCAPNVKDTYLVGCDLKSLMLDDAAPLSKWDQARQPYDTAAQCETARQQPMTEEERQAAERVANLVISRDQALPDGDRIPKDFVEQFVSTRKMAIQLSRCIATDDPRLK